MSAFNDRVIATFRANGGRVDGWGSGLVLLHTVGARSGLERVNPALSLRDGDAWLVVASALGAVEDPAWAVNLRAHPDVEIEVASAGAVVLVPVTASELDGEAYDTAFARFVAKAPAFATYQDGTERRLPVVRLAPRDQLGGDAR